MFMRLNEISKEVIMSMTRDVYYDNDISRIRDLINESFSLLAIKGECNVFIWKNGEFMSVYPADIDTKFAMEQIAIMSGRHPKLIGRILRYE